MFKAEGQADFTAVCSQPDSARCQLVREQRCPLPQPPCELWVSRWPDITDITVKEGQDLATAHFTDEGNSGSPDSEIKVLRSSFRQDTLIIPSSGRVDTRQSLTAYL